MKGSISMYAKKLKCSLALALMCSVFSGSHAGLEQDAKSLFNRVTQHSVYRRALQLAVGIYSFDFLRNLIQAQDVKLLNDHKFAPIVLSFIGAYILSKLAEENPGTATLGCAAWAGLKHFKVINPQLK